MGWKPLRLDQSEYRKKLENIRDGMIKARDAMIEEDGKRIENLANVIKKANEHKAAQNDLDTKNDNATSAT